MQLSASPWSQFAALADPQTHRYLLGLVFILLQCIVWILAAIMTQYLFEEEEFQSPFLMSYIGMSLLALLLPVRACTDYFGMTGGGKRNHNHTKEQADDEFDIKSLDSFHHEFQQASNYTDYMNIATRRTQDLIHNQHSTWNHRKHMLAAIYIAPAMFFADWAFNAALAKTTVASATVLVSTQSVMVFILAVITRLEQYNHWKLAGVLMTIVGTTLTAFQDADSTADTNITDTNAIVGDILAVVAAAMYATYTIQVRFFCPQDEELYSMQLLLGYIGWVCFVPLLPFALWIGMTQVRLSGFIVGMILVKGALDFGVTDYLLFRSIILTNATIATVGLGLTIPMAFMADWALGKGVGTLLSFFGAFAVTIGFLVVNMVPGEESDEKESTDCSVSALEMKYVEPDKPSIQIS